MAGKIRLLLVGAGFVALGCDLGTKQPDFPELHPVRGSVRVGGRPATGGVVRFIPQAATEDFLINAEVGPDGRFELTTVRTTDKKGERKPGAPAGTYKVVYDPPLADQTAGPPAGPITAPKSVTVPTSATDLVVDLPKSL